MIEFRLGGKCAGQLLVGPAQLVDLMLGSFTCVVTAGRRPLPISSRCTHDSSVRDTQLIFDAIDSTAVHSDG